MAFTAAALANKMQSAAPHFIHVPAASDLARQTAKNRHGLVYDSRLLRHTPWH